MSKISRAQGECIIFFCFRVMRGKALSLEARLPNEPELSFPEGLGYFPSVLSLRTHAPAK